MSYSDLPLLNELLKPHVCTPLNTSTICQCKNLEENKETSSKSLQHWKEWMNRRKKIYLKLAEKVQREPGKLLMNHAEELRTVLERKIIIEHTRLVQYRDAQIPTLEYVEVPKKVMSEKNVNPKQRTITTWAECAYFKSRCQELSFEMSVVEPHKPELSDLCIEGFSFSRLNMPKLITKKIAPNGDVKKQESSTETLKICVIVNGVTLTPTVKQSHTRKVYIMFDYDVTTKKVATQYLRLVNTGNTAVHYSWDPVKKIPLFRDILPVKEHNTHFFFNKNKGVVIPEETINLPIWFNVEKPGVYCETWEFRTKPKIVPPNSRIIVIFHASAVTGDLDKKMEQVQDRLNTNIRNRLIKETLSSVLSKVQYDKFKPTTYCYNKKEVFEAMSTTYDPTNYFPKYEYNKDTVRELQKFYKNVRRSVDPKNWNYSIYELKLLTDAKQKSNENEKLINDHQITKKLESQCPILATLDNPKTVFPQMDSDSRLQQKNAVLSPNEAVELKKQLNSKTVSLNDELEKLLHQLERPHIKKNFEKDKYTRVYLLLCTCINKIENEIENLKAKLGIDKQVRYPAITVVNESCEYERLLDAFVKPILKENINDSRYKLPDKLIQCLPANECVLRYKTYYKLPDSPTDVLRRMEITKLLFKEPETLKKSKICDVEPDDGYIINETFDPYATTQLVPFKEHIKSPKDDKRLSIEKPDNIQVIMQHYKNYIYMIVYDYLNDAIGNIIDMLEMYSFQHTPHPVIKEIEEPNYTRRLIDLKSLIIQENIDNLKAKLVLNNYRKKSKLDWKSIETQRELKRVQSCSSLWSILRPYEKPELYEEKPISYPNEIYEDDVSSEMDKPEKEIIDRTTSTEDARIDNTRKDFYESAIQKDYEPDEKIDDLEEYIEKIKSETSVQSLIDFPFSKETQKDVESNVSDEEHFYYSLTDSELSDISIESVQSTLSVTEEMAFSKPDLETRSKLEKTIVCNCPK